MADTKKLPAIKPDLTPRPKPPLSQPLSSRGAVLNTLRDNRRER